jgi:RNA polymerase-binding transcription factor DksA
MKNKEHYNKILEDERKILLGELQSLGIQKDQRNPDDWQARPDNLNTLESDSNEVSDKIESYENNNALVNDLEQRLMEVDIALEKIKKGNFGICEICGKEIESDRLEANPAARTCKEHINKKI